MDDEDFNNDAIDAVLRTRRIPHGRSSNRQGKSKGGPGPSSGFDPLRARGRYEVGLGSGKKHTGGSDQVSNSWLEIHELTEGNDALIGTFSFASKAQGMCVLAGSRKGLAKAVQSLESTEDVEETSPEDDADDDEAEETDLQQHKSILELEDEKQSRTKKAFEKNTFRSPKFWMTWRSSASTTVDDAVEPNIKKTAYLVFAGNDCQRFEGTISSTALDWDNLKVRGRKIHSRASPCPLTWSDLS